MILLEAGPKDSLLWIHIPAGVLKLLYHPVVNWNYSAEGPQEARRRIHWPRGKTLGGSSSINGMLYVRGNPADFDGWAQMGCRGWSFDDVLPYFRKSEDYKQGADPGIPRQGRPAESRGLPHDPAAHAQIHRGRAAGWLQHSARTSTAGEQEGVGYSQMTRKGRWRGSTAQTFLKEAQGRPNLRVETEALATKLLFEGKRCVGVAFRQRGQTIEARAHKEVHSVRRHDQLAASAADIRGRAGGASANDRRAGGARSAAVSVRICRTITLRASPTGSKDRSRSTSWPAASGWRREVLRFAVEGRGALTFGVTTAQVFCRSSPEKASPDLQLLFTPASYDAARFGELEREDGMTVAVCPVRPDSRGTMMARSADPTVAPVITPNYLSDPGDGRVLIAGMRFAREIFASPAIAAYSAVETLPGPDVTTDDALLDYARRFGTTIFHPVGTCRMGDGPSGVVDQRLRVHGIVGLRIIDASVMPTLTTGNTNAPTIMIGEKGAAMIREDNAAPDTSRPRD